MQEGGTQRGGGWGGLGKGWGKKEDKQNKEVNDKETQTGKRIRKRQSRMIVLNMYVTH